MVPRIAVTCPGSQGTSCPCSPFMTRVKVPGSSFMLCLGPGPSSLLHLTRANAEKPYAGDTSIHVNNSFLAHAMFLQGLLSDTLNFENF